MKKTLFLTAIIGAALCGTAFGETVTINGTQNNLNLNDAAYAGKDLILNLTGGYFYGNGVNSVFTQNIQVGDGSENQGGIIGNNGWGNLVTFSGTITGNGEIKKTGAGTNLKHAFTGDVTGYTGNIVLGASANFFLCFGAVNDGTAATTQNSTADAGVSGTGDITFTSGYNDLVYKYAASAASEGPVYITNAIKKDGGTAKVQLLGGASYSFTKDVTIDTLTLGDNSIILLDDSAKRSSLGSIQGTGTLKYTGDTRWEFGRANMAATVTLEGVMAEDGVTSNVKYNANYGVNAGIIKNVNVENLDAGAVQGSITMDGVYGYLKNGGTQRNITLTGDGLHLTAGFSNGSYGFQKLDGSGNLVKQAAPTNETFTFQNATEWTGAFVNEGGSTNLVFDGNSNADIIAKGATNVTLKGTDYSDMHIKAYNGNTANVTVQNATSDVTIEQLIKDPYDASSHGTMNVTINTAGHKAIVEEWATVNNITLQNGSGLQLNNHNIGTLTVQNGSSTVTSGNGTAAIGSDQHTITNVTIGEDADLTVASGNAMTVSQLTLGAGSTITVGSAESHDNPLTLNTLIVEGEGATVNANLNLTNTTDLTLNAALTLGCTVNLGDGGITLSGDLLDNFDLTTEGSVTLFNDVEGVTVNGTAYTEPVAASIVFSNTALVDTDTLQYTVSYNADNTVTLNVTTIVPEPATATLSLLALAALASRRRRK